MLPFESHSGHLSIITPEHLKPNGMLCEACHREFAVGDEYAQNIVAYTDSTPRDFEALMTPEQRAEVEDWDAPIPIYGEHRCRACFDADRPVRDD